MVLELPEDWLLRKDYSEKDFRIDAAVLLYQRQIISLARAARWCQLTRLGFQKELGKRNVAINFTVEDFKTDLETLKSMPPL